MLPKISLIIPCYNVERYVEKCVRSAMGQTMSDIEIICVNDGSTDGTLSLLQKLASEDKRIKIIDKPNSGYGNTMNVGFDAAQGEYIGILESDDFIKPDMLEKHYTIARKNNLDVVKSNFFYYWSIPTDRSQHCNLLDEDECGRVLRPRDEKHIFFVKPSIWSAIYRADFIRDNNIRFNETPGASYQDASFNFQVWLNAERVWFLRDAFLYYRQDNEASSVNSPGKVFCVCDEYERMESFLDEWPDSNEAREMRGVLIAMKFDSYLWNYDRLSPDLADEFFKRFVEEMKGHEDRGEIVWDALRDDKRYELRWLLSDPEYMLARHKAILKHPTRFGRILSYFHQGGLSYVLKPLQHLE